MGNAIIEIINRFGYLGVFLLIALENIFPPIPSEVILTFSGFMTTFSTLKMPWVIVASTLGSVAGAIVLYLVGRALSKERLERLFDSRFGHAMHLEKGDVAKADRWFARHGNKAVFFCRFVPIVRSLISIPAGSSKMNPTAFLTFTVVGTAIWNFVLVLLGRLAGNAWDSIAKYFDTYSMIAAAVLLIVLLLAVGLFIKKRFIDRRKV